MIETRHLLKTYGAARALDDVSITVGEGTFTAILGPSGAGKSTLFRTVLGLLQPDSGVIIVDGMSINGDRSLLRTVRPKIAPVFQGFHLVSRLSALSNVLVGQLPFANGWRTALHRFTRQEKEWAQRCLERVGLGNKTFQRADTLSGGEQQRVAVARGLAQRAKIFYADEPISSLDPELGLQMLELLRTINRQERVTVVCNLHQVDLARDFADSLIGLRSGQVRFQKRTIEVSEDEFHSLYQRGTG